MRRSNSSYAPAGMSATYPLDMVRGRLTVQNIQGINRYRGILHATSVIIKEVSPGSTQGLKGFRISRANKPRSTELCQLQMQPEALDGEAVYISAKLLSFTHLMIKLSPAGGDYCSVEGLATKCHWRHTLRGAHLCGVRDPKGLRPEVLRQASTPSLLHCCLAHLLSLPARLGCGGLHKRLT